MMIHIHMCLDDLGSYFIPFMSQLSQAAESGGEPPEAKEEIKEILRAFQEEVGMGEIRFFFNWKNTLCHKKCSRSERGRVKI